MARRLQQTLADYLVIAISPALIMLLVGSLVFFLLRVFYQGSFPERLMVVQISGKRKARQDGTPVLRDAGKRSRSPNAPVFHESGDSPSVQEPCRSCS